MRLQRVLSSGIGVHHSGILPLLKEIVEILFQTGYVSTFLLVLLYLVTCPHLTT